MRREHPGIQMKTVNQLLTERKNFPLKVRPLYLLSAVSHGFFGGMLIILYFLRAGTGSVPHFHYYTADLISLPYASSSQTSSASSERAAEREDKKGEKDNHTVISSEQKKKEPEKNEHRKEVENVPEKQASKDSRKKEKPGTSEPRNDDGRTGGFSVSGGGRYPGGGSSLSGLDTRFAWYRATVVDILNANWIQVADDYTQQNRSVIVHFAISETGHITDVVIEASSGSALLDRGVRRAIQASDPLPPIPQGFGKDRLTARFRFIY